MPQQQFHRNRQALTLIIILLQISAIAHVAAKSNAGMPPLHYHAFRFLSSDIIVLWVSVLFSMKFYEAIYYSLSQPAAAAICARMLHGGSVSAVKLRFLCFA